MVTIVLPVSRKDYLDAIFARLETLECDKEQTNLFVYVDGDLQLYQKARNLTVNSKFKERLCVYRRKGQPNVGSIKRRRQRIADIHNEIKEHLAHSDYLFLIEDDTLFPERALKQLLKTAYLHSNAGIVSGIQLGRWGYRHIGAWRVDDIYDVKKITSVPLEVDGTKEVDATGLYCCVVRMKTYMDHKFNIFEEALGTDVHFGLSLRQGGLLNYIDYNLKVVHLTKKEEIRFMNSKVIQVELTKDDSVRFGWRLKSI